MLHLQGLPNCPGRVNLEVGQVNSGSNLPKWVDEIRPKDLHYLLSKVKVKYHATDSLVGYL